MAKGHAAVKFYDTITQMCPLSHDLWETLCAFSVVETEVLVGLSVDFQLSVSLSLRKSDFEAEDGALVDVS